ncbi:MAG TPA: Ig-like domain-containing protein [Solirubrobacterales bacterium]|nr:Ig-like domain-containing protein [Solirubrobacterales bacterium]
MSGQRPGAMLRWIIVFTCLFGACVIAPGVAFSAEEEAEPRQERPGSVLPLPDGEELGGALSQAFSQHRQQLAQREAELASPAAVAERERSRLAYADIGDGAAEELLHSVFGPVLAELNQDPARLLSDATVERYAGDEGAVVTSDGETQLLESNLPLQAEEENGDLGQVDVTLAPTAEGWEPENPVVDLAIGGTADEGIEIGDEGLTVTQAGAEDAVAAPLGDKSLFFGEVTAGSDTDQVVAPISSGVEIFNLLRSADSPESLRFQLDLPAGSELRAGPGGSAEVVDADGALTTLVPKPWALDAQGTQVPVEMTVDGDSLVLAVAHRDQDLAYPILVDPSIYQDWDSWYNGQGTAGLAGWRWQQTSATWIYHGTEDSGGFPNYPGKGLFVYTAPATMQGQQWGQWIYSAPPGAYLVSATISPFTRNNRGCPSSTNYYPYDYEGMWRESSGWANIKFNNANDYGTSSLGTWGESLIIGLSTDSSTNTTMTCWRDLMIGGVGIMVDDWQIPWMTILVPFPTSWMKKDATARTVEVKGTDMGLGVQKFILNTPGKEWTWDQPYCAGTYEDRCATERTGKITYTTEGVGAEGKVPVFLQVIDPTDKRGTVERTLSIDGTAPTVTLGGSSTGIAYNLSVESKDGSSTEPRSGVKEAKVYLDGVLKETKTNTCTSSGCPETLNFSYTQSYSGLSSGFHVLEVVATDQVGYTKAATRLFNVEAPNTLIDSGPEGLTKQSAPTFTYHSTAEGSTFACSVDGAAYVSCPATGYATAKLADGAHTFSVRATSLGLTDASPATRSFTVDTTAPDTTIEAGPSGTTIDTQPSFGYSSADLNARFECRLDAAAFEPCGYGSQRVEPALTDGSHTYAVRAVDQAGNADATPATRSFTVDATGPTLEILSGPAEFTNVAKPKYTFKVAGQTVLQCALYSDEAEIAAPTYGACTSSSSYEAASALVDGSYSFWIKAKDASGNVATESRGFTLDTKAPETTISSGPSATTDDPKPAIGFASSDADSSFACRFDAEAFAACAEPLAYPKTTLADGAHSFEVKATDPSGNVDATPAKRSFTVFTAAPQTKVVSGPEGPTADTTPSYTYSADETATFECRVDTALFASCAATGKELAVQAEGQHVFEVRARNAAGVDPTPASRTFIVDVSNPSETVLGGEVFAEPGPYGLDLSIQATDGDRAAASTTRAGVEYAALYIDGVQTVTLRNRCGATGCPDELDRDYQVSPYKAAGTHAYKLVVRDPLGHERVNQWSRTIPSTSVLRQKVSSKAVCAPKKVRLNKRDSPYFGKSCNEIVISHEGVSEINTGDGDDIIVGGPSAELIEGGEGNDVIRGARSNDKLYGQGGNDFIYGGPGDDKIMRGGPGADLVDGGPGTDSPQGQDGNDVVRGGQGGDTLSGGADNDTVSFADAIAPGYHLDDSELFGGVKVDGRSPGYAGVYVEVTNVNNGVASGSADNGPIAEERGGEDSFSGVESIVGSAFDDVIKRQSSSIEVAGGPGGDIIIGGGGKTGVTQRKGDNDYIEGDADHTIGHPQAIEFGLQTGNGGKETDLFLSGSPNSDDVTVNLRDKGATFTFHGGAPTAEASNCNKSGNSFNCKFPSSELGAVVLAGFASNDTLATTGRDELSKGSVTLAGGPGPDVLQAGPAEEMAIDGDAQGGGEERLLGMAGDDVLIQAKGNDLLRGDGGNDLLISSDLCSEGSADRIVGSTGSDNAQFHPFQTGGPGVYADLKLENNTSVQNLGTNVKGEHTTCGTVKQVEDLEGSPQGDDFEGSARRNLLLGRGGADILASNKGRDRLNARDLGLDERIDCSNFKQVEVFADPGVEFTENGKSKKLNHPPFEHCKPSQVSKEGEIYDDGQNTGARLAAVTPDPARLERLLGEEETEPPEGELPASEEEVEPALASYLALDDEGASAVDSFSGSTASTYGTAGGGASLTAASGPETGVEGGLREEEGTAVALDGVDDVISVSEPPPLEEAAGSGLSLELLVKFSRAAGAKEYLYSSGTATDGLFLYRGANGVITLATGNDVGAPSVNSYLPVTDSTWHQVVGEVEGDGLTLYLDGIPSRVGFGEEIVSELPEAAPETTIGAGPGGTGFLAATVDEVSSYVGPLSENEVAGHLMETVTPVPNELLVPEAVTSDYDGDGAVDDVDNCPNLANGAQTDVNEDGIGDSCVMPDLDGDEVQDSSDNCAETPNSDQADADGDGVGDACEWLPGEATTGAASEVKAETARVNGVVVPGGTETTYKFEYGTTTLYGKSVPLTAATVSAGRNPVAVSQALSGLAPQTTYHYRLVTENVNGVAEGEDLTFTTTQLPTATQLAKLPVTEPFDGSSTSLSNFSASWTKLGWSYGKGEDATTGWRPIEAFPADYGAFYAKSVSASASGIATVATLAEAPTIAERYFSAWLGMPTPTATAAAGYELRFTETATRNVYDVTLSSWSNGTKSLLTQKLGYSFPEKSQFALVAKGGIVSAWVNTGAGFTEILAVKSATYSAGYAGIEAAGNILDLSNFKAGPLPES